VWHQFCSNISLSSPKLCMKIFQHKSLDSIFLDSLLIFVQLHISISLPISWSTRFISEYLVTSLVQLVNLCLLKLIIFFQNRVDFVLFVVRFRFYMLNLLYAIVAVRTRSPYLCFAGKVSRGAVGYHPSSPLVKHEGNVA